MKYTKKIGEKTYITFEQKDIDDLASINIFKFIFLMILFTVPIVSLVYIF